MGIQDLPAIIKQCANNVTVDGAGLEGMVIGVDLSVLIYDALTRKLGVEQFHAEPPVPVVYVISYLEAFVEAMAGAGVLDIVFVFDGSDHPLKEDTQLERRHKREEVAQKLREIYQNEQEADVANVRKLQRQCVSPRGECVSAQATALPASR